LVRERGGYTLMPELGYSPTNHYLPPRERPAIPINDVLPGPFETAAGAIKGWVNKVIKR